MSESASASHIDHRARLHRYMTDTLADERRHHDWYYHAVRPMYVPRSWRPGQVVRGDCSKGVQYLCRWADCPDPMKMGFGAFGNSETLTARLQHLDHAHELLVGDIVTFGTRGEQHAAMVMARGSDPLLWSFGHQGAPNPYRLSRDRRTRYFLRNPVPKYVPTAEDKLRAKHGYWAWLQWKLGEGDWHHHKPGARRVRPNVPRVIPPRWWVRYYRYMRNRRLGNPIGTRRVSLA